MSRLIVKVKYYNPRTATKSIAGYAQYIATREGVEIRNQKDVDTTYADYIATRPGVEIRGNHGLFSTEDRPISLKEVSDELKNYQGNVWTVIVSLKRDDAEKTGFDNSETWRELITAKKDVIAKNFSIPIDKLNCYAAFHNEKEHPHIHMIIYSKEPKVYGGYHKESSLQNLKSAFVKEIFSDELTDLYQKKDAVKNDMKKECIGNIYALAESISKNKKINSHIKTKMINLAHELKNYEGKKVYGYLPKELKQQVDEILRDLTSNSKFEQLYDNWYKLKDIQQEFYNSEPTKRIPIEQNEDFKSIRNAIVKVASRIDGTKAINQEKCEDNSSELVLEEIIDLLCMFFIHQADNADLGMGDCIVEHQSEVDKALGIKHT